MSSDRTARQHKSGRDATSVGEASTNTRRHGLDCAAAGVGGGGRYGKGDEDGKHEGQAVILSVRLAFQTPVCYTLFNNQISLRPALSNGDIARSVWSAARLHTLYRHERHTGTYAGCVARFFLPERTIKHDKADGGEIEPKPVGQAAPGCDRNGLEPITGFAAAD